MPWENELAALKQRQQATLADLEAARALVRDAKEAFEQADDALFRALEKLSQEKPTYEKVVEVRLEGPGGPAAYSADEVEVRLEEVPPCSS